MSKKLLEMKNIEKSFLGVPVLKKVDFSLDRGQVISIIGTNGAGKSTLSNIIAGVYGKDGGTVEIDGEQVDMRSPNDAEKYGIGMVHQEPTLCENMRVYENIFLNREINKKSGLLDREKMKEESRRVLSYLGFDIDVEEIVQNLSLVGKGVVSIAKAMLMNPKILILDEVTAPLNQKEVEHLFEVVCSLREKGLGIIYISHKIKEIVAISDEVVVLKDGENVGTFVAKEEALSEKKIIHLMLGETEGWQGEYSEKQLEQHQEETLLKLQDLSKDELYENISIDLHKGEIIGLAGLKGSGITELMFSVFGVLQPDSGEIIKDGVAIKPATPKEAIRSGIGMITNDRQKEGAAIMLSVEDNITVASLDKMKQRGMISGKKLLCATREYIDKLQIKTTGPKQAVQFLSGGNQQKVVVAKWLLKNAQVILIDEPTRGVDVKAKNEIYNLLITEKMQGKGIIVFSPETRELLNICDRILVLTAGKITSEINRADENFNEKGVMEAMHSF